ncbi:hypothetical protein J2T56_000557 [Natronobacillus azotifigens]|uniref:Swarming motility protein SwrB n=1 Tax=Natronobacillus azotifigens TaxID=472978 RepID=A0A9J6RB49_9BACI|nr:hypothetical protein [Natronobacillus azotifigens]MCZ0702590.1 hypothetical protein [Natronobacillus azotifigens]
MEYFLLLISFIIHIITLVIIRQLKVKLAEPAVIRDEINQEKKEIEELLAVYLLEIREENEKVISALDDSRYSREPDKQKADEVQDNNVTSQNPVNDLKQEEYKSYQPPMENEQPDVMEQSFAAQVLSLYNKGETIETIARKMDKGKTEIELIVKFQQKNR